MIAGLSGLLGTSGRALSATRRCSSLRQTIFALSSGEGRCGVAVIRVSGPRARCAVEALTGTGRPQSARRAYLRVLRDPQSLEELDRAIVLWFPGPRSFTGEDSCEFQVHGGAAVVSGVLAALSKLPGLRSADPGEFSKRAFYNGKMDLTEAEGLADLIDAETEMQRRQALLQMGGSLHELYQNWRSSLIRCVAHVEAYIDFSEDENIEEGVMEAVEVAIRDLYEALKAHLADSRRGQRLRSGVAAAILGEPNAGKSTLLNTLCHRPAAIVTPIAGTTRDIVQQYVNIGGYPLNLADTAGLRQPSHVTDVVEREGIDRALIHARTADLLILVIESSQFLKWLNGQRENLNNLFHIFLKGHVEKLGLNMKCFDSPQPVASECPLEVEYFVVLSKADLILNENDKEVVLDVCEEHDNVALISCASSEGMPAFLSKLQPQLQRLCGQPSRENPSASQERHRQHLSDCLGHLEQYLRPQDLHLHQPDLAASAEELRRALHCLGKVTGHVTTEHLLDVIFRDFCIGK